jgi:hypothetical protein
VRRFEANSGRETGHLALQPRARHLPLALHRARRRADHGGGLFDRQAAEEAAARTVAISREKLGQTLAQSGSAAEVAEATELLRAALGTHSGLATADPDNAQARCDTARVAEELGDVHQAARQRDAASTAPADAATCATWRESVRTREALKTAGRTACATPQDLERLAIKLRGCR